MSTKVSIIIPNWNGKAFLSKCVAAILESATQSGLSFECLLMDDASTDGSGQEAKEKFPQVSFLRSDVNRGFGHMVNEGARQARGEILVLVNNDLVAKPDFIRALCAPFETGATVFGVSGKTVGWEDAEPNHVNMRGRFENGCVRLTWSDDASITETMFLQGGSCAVRRDLFLEFGGFNPLYAPGYWEDYDISYQALKAGHSNYYEPAAVGSHLGQGSMIRAHGRERIDFVKARNKHLLLALNLTDDQYHRAFWDSMPHYVRRGSDARFKHRLAIVRYLFSNRKQIERERQIRYARRRVSDDEVFSKFAEFGTLC